MNLFNSLELISVSELLLGKFNFYVPAYQRGYRWGKEQAIQLIDDLVEFAEYHYFLDKSKFYCLQPLVVKLKDNGDQQLEIIDGQQRLTTILLILQALHLLKFESVIDISQLAAFPVSIAPNLYSIKYETRVESSVWLKEISEIVYDLEKRNTFENKNCDYYHFAEVFCAVYGRLKQMDEICINQLTEVLHNGTKFIWYYPTSTSGSNADVFDRLNAGKIGLNNAELIKALFLQQSNWSENDIAKAKSLALEWGDIENCLQKKEFWGFIVSSQYPFSYDCHIEYLFDLLKGKKKWHEDKHFFTFNQYLDEYREMMRSEGKDVRNRICWVEDSWLQVKQLFDTLTEWYDDRHIFHRIGFILEYVPEENVLTLIDQLKGRKHSERLEILDDIIRTKVSKIKSSQLFYGRKELSEILFLYNILLEDKRIADNARFSFAEYKNVKKNKGWDQEHVASHVDYSPDSDKVEQLAMDVIELFTGAMPVVEGDFYSITSELWGYLDTKETEICNTALQILNTYGKSLAEKSVSVSNQGEPERQIENFYSMITAYFEKETENDKVNAGSKNRFGFALVNNREMDEKDFIWNFVLLNASTNRSYGNNIYPVKRRRILQDELSVYTPVGTRNVFEKAYSRRIKDMFYWSKTDAMAYWNDICKTLTPYTNLTLPF